MNTRKQTRTPLGLHVRRSWASPVFQLKIVLLLLIILGAIGVTFYHSYLRWDWRDALYQVVLTVSTLGGNPPGVPPMDEVGVWFSIFYIIAILAVALWGVSLLVEATVSGYLVYHWGVRRMEQRIAKLSNHYIICGFGRMGQEIARQFTRGRQPFVVLEHNAAQLPILEASGHYYVRGDAREDDQLLKAGIERAKGLVAVAASDEENVYIVLSARVLNPDLFIVTRSSQPTGEAKLIRAGANRVFSPYIIGGLRMAQAVMHPSVVDFLDTIVHGEQMELVLEEVTVGPNARFCGKTIAGDTHETDLECLGVHVLGIATADGRTLMRNLTTHPLAPGDIVILLGDPTSVQAAMQRLAGT